MLALSAALAFGFTVSAARVVPSAFPSASGVGPAGT